jgi:hypothetical protein
MAPTLAPAEVDGVSPGRRNARDGAPNTNTTVKLEAIQLHTVAINAKFLGREAYRA